MADDTAYEGLFGGDSSQWAFGTDFEDPLAGVDTTMVDDVVADDLALYCLGLADDALIMSQRLSEWCSRAPEMEDDVALANLALDLLGQARLLLARAAAASPSVVPVLPEGSPVPPEDALAFFRSADQFRNVRLVEVPGGDFAHIIVRLLLFSVARRELLERLRGSRDQVISAVAARGVKEVSYHRDWSARWFVVLARGTTRSRRRLIAALDELWPYQAELVKCGAVDLSMADAGVGVDPSAYAGAVDAVLDQVLAASGVERPSRGPLAGVDGRFGRDGVHTEALSLMLAEMQVVARAHPRGRW
ncbi:1,2-phenylacetyl-CoA epoxidase subunit PaaC [Kineosporia sp. NBRC 101731]|uniref:1,2-phenylacetyl-CoA epoxidase subunit PaaC n=1 Tax=Kineosporia sp. NBRC 101731 TaxID=3032199 RepID=UPI0024A5F0A9|nr:1,2-phenylacetyl-CoA epoxidase subunit PaaC [Kineosporia sp. NBRC 101731]GLY33260.1 putative phenylacetic acid degradation protein PaaC/phenylacetate-CoA oxygenase, PaaI subunit [Kineosporia sp. NBRC 101731]